MTDNRTTELLPCPFCGVEYTQVRWIGFKDKSNGAFDAGYRGECCDCGALTRAYDTEAEAIEAWNTRAERTCTIPQDWHEWPACSACGASCNRIDNYCPNCGAKVVDS